MHVKRIKNFVHTYKENPLALFLLKGFLFFLLWDLLVYDYLITPAMHDWVIYRLLDFSKAVLGCFFQNVTTVNTELYINGMHCAHIGIPCNGLDVMGVFASIVLAYNAKWFHKVWMILGGCILVFLLNSARISILSAFIYHHERRAFDINHKYIFNIILYGILLLVFSVWSSKFGISKTRSID
jgi:exosortase/archaeosortase family protein